MKKIFFFVSILLFFFSHSLFSQNQEQIADSLYEIGKDFYYDGDYKKAKPIFEKVLEVRTKLYGKDFKIVDAYFRLGKTEKRLRYHQMALATLQNGLTHLNELEKKDKEYEGDFYMEIAEVYDQMYNLKKSKFYYEKCLNIFKEIYGERSADVGAIYMDLGYSFTKGEQYRLAKEYLEIALDIFNKKSKPDSEDFNRIYNNLGYFYKKTGDYEKALDFGRKALTIKLLNYNKDHPSVAKYHINIADAYYGKKEYDEGLKYMQRGIEIYKDTYGEDHPQTAGSMADLADYYMKVKKFDAAENTYKESIRILEKRLSLTHPFVVAGYESLGLLYEYQGDYQKALDLYKFTLEKYQNHIFVVNSFVANAYHNISIAFLEMNQLDSALFNIGKALENISSGFSAKDIRINPPLSSINIEDHFLYYLETKAEILEKQFYKNNTIANLEIALNTLDDATKMIEKMRRSYQSESSKQSLNERSAPIFRAGVKVAFKMYQQTKDTQYLLKALNFSEKSKASILWQSMNENFALENAGIPKEELNDLEKLGFEIQDLSEKVFESQSTEKEQLQNQLFDLKLKYENQISSLEKFNPAYFELKYALPEVISDDFIKGRVNESTALIEYFYDDDNIYTFLISNGDLHGFQDSVSEEIEESIQYLRNYKISNSSKNALAENEKYIAQLNFLYQELIRPVENELNDLTQLIIVPHGVLNYLPFEMLSPKSDKKDFRQLPYLIRNYNIQYAWSFAFLGKNKSQQRNYKFDYLGFAPSFGNQVLVGNNISSSFGARANLTELNFTESEILKANELFQGNVFSGKNASESLFNQFAKDSKIIHLATHAFANDRQPMQSGFLFSNQKDTLEDGYLNTYEIYNMKLPAELTVMSACNTGFGQLAEGEGVISLGRAFSYAGCRSVVMSLWMANDQSTASLMSYFYESLAEGNRKDMALKNAKIRYLENADPLTAHPYFWAGMVAIGDMDSISSSENNWFWLFGFGVVGVLFLFIFKNIKRS
ncbi:MAG: CHAT domain-containing protein [Saprospiraceae bacterium]